MDLDPATARVETPPYGETQDDLGGTFTSISLIHGILLIWREVGENLMHPPGFVGKGFEGSGLSEKGGNGN